MPAINTKFPPDLDTAKAKDLLVSAMNAGLSPDFSVSDGTEVIGNVWLSTSQAIQLDAYVVSHPGRSRAAVTFGLIRTAHRAGAIAPPPRASATAPQGVLQRLIQAGAVGERRDQSVLVEALLGAVRSGKILMAEAGTGTGKSLAICCTAYELCSDPSVRVAIAAPTYAILRQLHREWDLIDATLGDVPEAISLFGKQEFVDVGRTQDLLSDPECAWDDETRAAIRAWIADQGRAPEEDPWAPPYLVGSFVRISGCEDALPTLGYGTDADDPGLIAYTNQFLTAREVPVVFLTHAMLAIDLRNRCFRIRRDQAVRDEVRSVREALAVKTAAIDKRHERSALAGALRESLTDEVSIMLAAEDAESRHIAPYDYLLLDEAHSFEETASQVMSLDLSLASIRAQARKAMESGTLPKSRFEMIRKGVESLIVLSDSESEMTLNVMGDAHLREATAQALQQIAAGLSKAGTQFQPQRLALSAILRQIQTGITSLICMIEFSPVKRWPRIYAGRRSIQTELTFLWSGIKGGACVSATLYTPKSSGELSAWLMQSKLCIPDSLIKTMAPLAPPWLFSPITMYCPKGNEVEPLLPVSMSRRRSIGSLDELAQAEQKWILALHSRIVPIVETAVGGTLILCVSYDTVGRLAELLAPTFGERLVVADRSEAFARQVRRYMDLARQAQRPVWLATGAAWTGLDLTQPEKAPEDDDTITDLVVTRLPFGLSQSLGQKVRMAMQRRDGYLQEALDCARRLRQGLGRGVRRQGLKRNRRYFVLDGRLGDPGALMMCAPSLRVLDAYRPRLFALADMKDMRE